MTLGDLSFYLFTLFNGLRVVSYLPQILRVARDENGASAISYTTWLLWTGANATTGLYAGVNLGDPMLAAINWLNAVCCALVIALTAWKRRDRVAKASPAGESGYSALSMDNLTA
jgi:hypothetical protein